MKKNLSTPDRLIRIVLSGLFFMLMLNNYEDEMIRIFTGVVGVYCLLTALLEFCILYTLLKVSTKSSRKDRHFY